MRPESIVVVLAALLAAGCSTLSQTECQTGNWKDIGYGDGTRGAKPERIDEHAKACAGHGLPVDREAWGRGYERGLEVFCTPENAVQIGLRGTDYRGVCPPGSDLEFTTHWRAGRSVWEQRQRVAQLDNRRRELQYAYEASRNDQERYNIRVDLARIDEQLRYEYARLRDEEARLNEFLRGVK
jgi:hypothetical protein